MMGDRKKRFSFTCHVNNAIELWNVITKFNEDSLNYCFDNPYTSFYKSVYVFTHYL